MLIAPKRTEHCRLPQRSDTVAGMELVVGLTLICAFPDSSHEQAAINAPADGIRASTRLKKKQRPIKGDDLSTSLRHPEQHDLTVLRVAYTSHFLAD
jgi:hypothetical protein